MTVEAAFLLYHTEMFDVVRVILQDAPEHDAQHEDEAQAIPGPADAPAGQAAAASSVEGGW